MYLLFGSALRTLQLDLIFLVSLNPLSEFRLLAGLLAGLLARRGGDLLLGYLVLECQYVLLEVLENLGLLSLQDALVDVFVQVIVQEDDHLVQLFAFMTVGVLVSNHIGNLQMFDTLLEIKVFQVRDGQVLVQFRCLIGILVVLLGEFLETLGKHLDGLGVSLQVLVAHSHVNVALE